MPGALRRWKPKEKSKNPVFPYVYYEYKAAKQWGYTMRSWQEESLHNRAKCVAQMICENQAEGYAMEMSMAKGGKGNGAPRQDYDSLLKSMGIA